MFAKQVFAPLIVVTLPQKKYSYDDSRKYGRSPSFVRLALQFWPLAFGLWPFVRLALLVCGECHKSFLCFDLTSESLSATVVTVSNKAYRTGEMMTRKDYKVIAESIRKSGEYFATVYSNDDMRETVTATAIGNVVTGLCEVLKQDNPLFNSDKFREACGL